LPSCPLALLLSRPLNLLPSCPFVAFELIRIAPARYCGAMVPDVYHILTKKQGTCTYTHVYKHKQMNFSCIQVFSSTVPHRRLTNLNCGCCTPLLHHHTALGQRHPAQGQHHTASNSTETASHCTRTASHSITQHAYESCCRYECAPLAFLIECAGGRSSDGNPLTLQTLPCRYCQ
jgi:hypothetical protein